MISKVKMIAPTYIIENTKSAYENVLVYIFRDTNHYSYLIYFLFSKRSCFRDQIYCFITPPEGPLWKQGHIDLFNAIPAIFNLWCF